MLFPVKPLRLTRANVDPALLETPVAEMIEGAYQWREYCTPCAVPIILKNPDKKHRTISLYEVMTALREYRCQGCRKLLWDADVNEQITYWLSAFSGDKYRAAARLALLWSRKLGNLASLSSDEGMVKIGGMSLEGESMSYRQGADFYADLAKQLDAGTPSTGGKVTGPGYVSTTSQFSIGMMDNL